MLWLRLRSGSVWTGALVHASINLWNDVYFTPLTAPRGAITNYTIDESGFMLSIVISITAYLFWRQRAAVLLRCVNGEADGAEHAGPRTQCGRHDVTIAVGKKLAAIDITAEPMQHPVPDAGEQALLRHDSAAHDDSMR